MQYVIIGAEGYVGSYLYRHMKMDGLDVIGTGHHCKEKKELIYFDVLRDSVFDITKLTKDSEMTAILCVIQSNFNRCKTEYELSRQINVISVKRIVEILIQEHFHVIYFSSDNVFDGTKGNYTEQDQTNAISQYGKMKEEMEQFLLKEYPEVCIFRMPRVVGAEREKRNMLTDFEHKLSDKEVKCIKDNRMSIISKSDVYHACLISSKCRMQGLYNLSNGEVYSRKELAEMFFEAMGVYNIDIIEWELEKFGFDDIRPLNTGLDNTKFRRETGYEFMSYKMMVKQYLMMNGYK